MSSKLKELAIFLEKMNNLPVHHIGYCGEQVDEIYDSLLNGFSDVRAERSFAISYNDNKITGAIGLDVDIEDQSAEVWGPFCEGQELSQMSKLWEDVIEKCGVPIRTFHFFLNERNEKGSEFVISNGGLKKGDHFVLNAARNEFAPKGEKDIIPYASQYKESFDALHQQAFPNTYYSADEIISRINSTNQLFLVPNGDNKIKGYVYVEADPTHHEGSIEFVAVSDDYRKQGIGTQLIRAALSHLFSQEIKEVTLSVGKDNESAIRLYRAAGFKVKHILTHFVLER